MFRTALIVLWIVPFVVGCSEDPHVAKQRYLERGDHYAAEGKVQARGIPLDF